MVRRLKRTWLRLYPAAVVAASLWFGPASVLAQGPAVPPTLPVAPETVPADPTPRPATAPVRPRLVPRAEEPPPVDPQVRPAADSGNPGEPNPLPPAAEKPGGSAPPPATAIDAPDGYKPSVDRIPLGKQTAGLSVEVVAPGVMNINQPATIKIVARNTGVADAMAVRVHYDLPRELALISSQPEAQRLVPGEPGLQWVLNTLAAGSEQILILKVKPIAVNTVDHAALVTIMVGGRSRTVIQEPMLKVEQSVSPSKVLQGQQVQFRIAVSNPGSGPARDVVVRATLSSGLKADREEVVEQTIPVLQAKERIELDPLIVDTYAGGEQTCTVLAISPDVSTPGGDAKVVRSVTVLRPELALDLVGPETRYTDTLAEYRLTIENPGTAAAKAVRVTVTLPPNSGRLQKPLPAGSEWNPSTNRLSWTIPNIEPKARTTSRFLVRLGGIGAYRVAAEAKAGALFQTDAVLTNVSGMADIELDISERKRVLDVGENTIFDIRMKNIGTKAARNLLVRAALSKNIEVSDTAGTDAEAHIDPTTGELVFPQIDSLAPGRTLQLSVNVKALKAGAATCRVFLMHDDLGDPSARLEDVAHTRVTAGSETSLK